MVESLQCQEEYTLDFEMIRLQTSSPRAEGQFAKEKSRLDLVQIQLAEATFRH